MGLFRSSRLIQLQRKERQARHREEMLVLPYEREEKHERCSADWLALRPPQMLERQGNAAVGPSPALSEQHLQPPVKWPGSGSAGLVEEKRYAA